MIARDLREALNALNPNHSLNTPEELQHFFVARPHSPLKKLRVMLDAARDPQKILFTGHRGCGKSTELAKLAQALDGRFFICKYSAMERLNTYDISYVDLLLTLGLELFGKALNSGVQLPGEVLRQLLDFTKQITTQVVEAGPVQGDVSAEINFLILKLGAKLKVEDRTRKTVRETLSPRVSGLLDMIQLVARSIEAEGNRRVLVIVEDLDKVDPAVAKQLFYDHASSLGAPRVSIIYTFPIAFRHDNDFQQVKMSFPTTHVLPIFKIRNRSGGLDNEALGMCRDILVRRVEAKLFDAGVIETLTEFCGGIPRGLIALAGQACLEAMTEDRTTIDHASVQEAVKAARRDFEVLLSNEQLRLLRQVHASKEIDNDAPHRALLHNLSCLEYWNDEVWYDVHPVVEPLLPPQEHAAR